MAPHRLGPALLLIAISATTPAAQSGYSAHIPSDTPATGPCSSIPMGGFFSQASFRSQRIQIVVTAAELGNAPHRITNLAFAPCGTGLRKYSRLTVEMGYQTGALGTTFDNNFVTRATKLLDVRSFEWPNVANQWNNIGLTRAFDYDPAQGNLMIDIVARNADFIGADPTMRADQRQSLHACCFSPTPRTGTLTNTSAKLRLSDGQGYIDDYGVGCGTGPLALNVSGTPNIGGQISLGMTGGNPSPQLTLGGVLIGAVSGRTNLDQFCNVYVQSLFVVRLPVQAGASPVVSLPLPNVPAFVGGKLYLQGANYDPLATTFGFGTSQLVAVTLGL